MLLLDLIRALRARRVPYALVGGYAVNLHGFLRGTVDIDLVLNLRERDFVNAEQAMTDLGLASRLPVTAAEVFRFREEYVANRNLTAWSFVSPTNPSHVVDIVITHDLATMQPVRKRLRDTSINVASIDDLIAMKRVSARPQDLVDIEALERLR
jgi:hypothetical protein